MLRAETVLVGIVFALQPEQHTGERAVGARQQQMSAGVGVRTRSLPAKARASASSVDSWRFQVVDLTKITGMAGTSPRAKRTGCIGQSCCACKRSPLTVR